LIYGLTWIAIWAIIGWAWNFFESIEFVYLVNSTDQTRVVQVRAIFLAAINGLITVVFFGVIGSTHCFTRDIRTAEALGWTWVGALRGCVCGIVGGVLIWLVWFIYWPEPDFRAKFVSTPIAYLLGYMIIWLYRKRK